VASGIVESSGSQAAKPSRSKIVQRLLDASADLPQFLHHLVTTQAVVVAGTEAAGFLVERTESNLGLRLLCHVRPDESDADTRAAAVKAFENLVRPCAEQNKDGAIEVGSPDTGEPQYCLVTLLRNEGQVVAISAVIARCRDTERARQRLGSLQLVAGYFDLYTLKRISETWRVAAYRHQHALQYASAVATAEGFKPSASALCNELAARTGASRVALGWVRSQKVKVKALSHTEKFDKKQDLIVQLERVMEECFDQDEPVRFDPAGESSPNVTRAARLFSQQQGGCVVLSLPLRRRDETVGILTLEFPGDRKPDEHGEPALVVAAELLAPQLYDRHENDRLIAAKVAHSVRDLGKLLIGPRHMLGKCIVALVLGLIALVTFYSPMYHVSAPFQLTAVEKRTLCAPFDGELLRVLVRPGEHVAAGKPLAEFDTLEKRKEQDYWNAQARKAEALRDAYRGDRDKLAEMKQAQEDLISAQLKAAQLQRQIDDAILRAPFDGIVVEGDLKDFENTQKKEGDPLFRFARSAPDNSRVIAVEAELAVADRDIEEVRRMLARPGQADAAEHGELATATFPHQSLALRITRIVPEGQTQSGENVFRVFAQVVDPPAWLQPGLTGEARIRIENRRLIWIWTHRLWDYLRLKLWL
jgi:multidrug efflux pump subunit AcrA (membrane-fusion protein)